MDYVPSEIIELILTKDVLNMRDAINFSSTCSRNREIVNDSSVIWKSKFFQRWPRISVPVVTENWLMECKQRRELENRMLNILSEMSPKFYTVNVIADTELEFINEVIDSYKYGYYYVVDYLLRLNSLPVSGALTIRYYSDKVLKFLKKKHLTEIWSDLINLEEKAQTLEKGAIFVANWFQMNEESVDVAVTQHLNSAAELVKKHVQREYKDHPLNKVSEESLLLWRNENIQGNMFEPYFCRQIITSINYVLFHELQYYYEPDLGEYQTKFGIDFAILDRRTTPLILGVIYESVARRLGVRCEIIHFPAHCLLRWKECYNDVDSPYYYIDMSGRGTFLSAGCCSRNAMISGGCPVKKPSFPHANMQQVADKAAQDIYIADRRGNHLTDRAVLELMLVLSPYDLECYRMLGRYYMCQEMDVRGLIEKMQAITPFIAERERILYQPLLSSFQVYADNWEQNNSNKIQTVKHRTEDIEFAVGMIGRHKRYEYTCVVYGWDSICSASPEWIHEMGVRNLLKKDQQPFYNVLVQDGSVRYVAQENLQILHTPPLICHPYIGRYFEEYCTTHYKPNKELETEYPEDALALAKLLRKHGES